MNTDTINRNDFLTRMQELEKRGISAPLTGEGDSFLSGILSYALIKAKTNICMYLPFKYEQTVSSVCDTYDQSVLDNKNFKCIFYGINLTDEEKGQHEGGRSKFYKETEVVKFPFVFYDDEYFAVEDYDQHSNKRIWVANLKSTETVGRLKSFFDRVYND